MRNGLIPADMLLAASLASACLISACAATRPPVASTTAGADREPLAGATSTTLYVARRRWHIDVGFSVGALPAPLAATASSEFPHAHYVFFGFGDRRYLLSKDHGAPVLVAALWPGPALILVTAIEDTPAQAFGKDQVVELTLSTQQARAVQAFIWASLTKAADGTLSIYAHGPYAGSAYFAAVPRYSGLHTCITWAAEALRSGGLRVRSRLTLVASQLWRQVLKLHPPPAAAVVPDLAPRVDAVSITGRGVAVLANHGGAAALRDDDSGSGRGRRTAAADAAGEQSSRYDRAK